MSITVAHPHVDTRKILDIGWIVLAILVAAAAAAAIGSLILISPGPAADDDILRTFLAFP